MRLYIILYQNIGYSMGSKMEIQKWLLCSAIICLGTGNVTYLITFTVIIKIFNSMHHMGSRIYGQLDFQASK